MKQDDFSLVPGAHGFLRCVVWGTSLQVCAFGRDGVFVVVLPCCVSLFFCRAWADGRRNIWYRVDMYSAVVTGERRSSSSSSSSTLQHETGVIPRGCQGHPHNAGDARRHIRRRVQSPGVSQGHGGGSASANSIEHGAADAAVTRTGSVCDRGHHDTPAAASRRAGPAPARR